MDALVSGQAGIAIFLRGNEASLVSMDALESEVVCPPSSIPHLLAGTCDVLELKSISKEKAIRQLQLAWQFDRALHLLLILLDSDEEDETRMMAAEHVLGLLTDAQVRERLENVLYSSRIPNPSAIDEARRFFKSFGAFPELLEDLQGSQPTIELLQRNWERLPISLFENPEDRKRFRVLAIHSGVFRLLAKSSGDPSSLSLAIVECYSKLKVLPNYRAVLGNWLAPFRPEKISHKEVSKSQTEDHKELEVVRETYSRKTQSSFEAFENVKKQKEAIVPLLRKGKLAVARKFVDELIQSQLRSGESRYATMSLCDLAQRAKDVCNYSLQLEFTQRAVELSPEDGWAHGQLADAYFCLGQYDNALQSFKMAALYGQPAFAKTGEARILWGQGRLQAALEVYDQAIREFPDDASPWNGRAEVLRQMWRYEEALKTYEEGIRRFPFDPVSWCGRAATLKDLGRLVDALQAYANAIRDFPEETFARDGYADVLKEMGQLKEALDVYNENIKLFSDDSVARCGRAEVLRAMGLFNEALQAYTEAIDDFPYVSVPYCGKAEVLRSLGSLEEALDYYQFVISRFPSEARARNGRANILKKLGRISESLQAYDQTIKDFPFNIFAWSGRADLLKESGSLDDALKAYDVLIARNPFNTSLRHAKSAILVIMRQFSQAEGLLPTKPPETRDDWVAYHIKGMILLKKDMLDPAIKHFKKGLDSIPFADERCFFRNALAIATLRQHQYREASEYLREGREAITDALRIHAFGELRKFGQASMAYMRLQRACPASLVPLRNELAARYKLVKAPPEQDQRWIFEEECRNVLLEAA